MIGWIIYSKSDAKRNEWLISEYQSYASKQGIALKLIYADNIAFGIRNNKYSLLYNNTDCALPDFVICRCIYPILNKQFELMGIPVFNNYHVSSICNDKRKTHLYLAGNNIEMIDTLFLNKKLIDNNEDFFYPSIIKSIDGHGGKEVLYVRNKDELLSASEKFRSDEFLMQKVASNAGSDIRVYVLGRTIIATVLRKSDQDFRSNFSLGGIPSLYVLSKKEMKIVKSIIEMFDFGLIGIDFIIDEGRIKFNEIEDVVGSRMLYKLTSIKTHELYIDFITNHLERQKT